MTQPDTSYGKDKVKVFPGSDLFHLKRFRTTCGGWFYCLVWLPIAAKIKGESYVKPD